MTEIMDLETVKLMMTSDVKDKYTDCQSKLLVIRKSRHIICCISILQSNEQRNTAQLKENGKIHSSFALCYGSSRAWESSNFACAQRLRLDWRRAEPQVYVSWSQYARNAWRICLSWLHPVSKLSFVQWSWTQLSVWTSSHQLEISVSNIKSNVDYYYEKNAG